MLQPDIWLQKDSTKMPMLLENKVSLKSWKASEFIVVDWKTMIKKTSVYCGQ